MRRRRARLLGEASSLEAVVRRRAGRDSELVTVDALVTRSYIVSPLEDIRLQAEVLVAN